MAEAGDEPAADATAMSTDADVAKPAVETTAFLGVMFPGATMADGCTPLQQLASPPGNPFPSRLLYLPCALPPFLTYDGTVPGVYSFVDEQTASYQAQWKQLNQSTAACHAVSFSIWLSDKCYMCSSWALPLACLQARRGRRLAPSATCLPGCGNARQARHRYVRGCNVVCLSCHVMPCYTFSCLVIPCHALPCPLMPCHTLSCLVS